MLSFIHKLLNPHCEHCAAERREKLEAERLARVEAREEIRDNSVCPSCETYKRQLEIRNHEYELLLNRLLEKPELPQLQEAPAISSKPRMVPWAVRRQMLEAEDRKKAQLMSQAPKPQSESVEDLEKELDVVQQEREAKNV